MAPVERWRVNIVFWRTASLPLASVSFFHSIFWEWMELGACLFTCSLFVCFFPVQAESIESYNNLRIWMLDYWLNSCLWASNIIVCQGLFVISLFCHLDSPSLLTLKLTKIRFMHKLCESLKCLFTLSVCVYVCVCVCVCVCINVCVGGKRNHYRTCHVSVYFLFIFAVSQCVCPRVCACVTTCVFLSNGLCASSLADGQDVSMATPGRS